MNAVDPIGGVLWLRPGARRPHTLRSTRPDWVGRVARGLPANRLPATLGQLFSLCGPAHSTCASLAVAAARGGPVGVPARVHDELARLTLREHLRSMWLDWPSLLSGVPPAEASLDAAGRQLARCPAWTAAPGEPPHRVDGLERWLEAHAFGMPLAAWVDAWTHDPGACLAGWCRAADTLPARLMRESEPFGRVPTPRAAPLRVHADERGLRDWAAELQIGGDAFAREPRWRGACADTGPWTRLADATPGRAETPWRRLGARLAEIARLALRGDSGLGAGSLQLGERSGLGWIEMARGLLIQHVRLDGAAPDARVASCHVISPTDWNGHPEGAFAAALETVPIKGHIEAHRVVGVLIAAYDPCVPCRLDPPIPLQELAHA